MTSIRGAWENYKETVAFAGIEIKPIYLILLTLVLAIGGFILGQFIDLTLGFLLAIVFIDLGFGLPSFIAKRKIEKIEKSLPDVLHHMSTTLKTGGTVETALREVSRMKYGPITTGLKKMLREIKEGSTFEKSLTKFAKESRSKLLKRTSTIIIAARRSGGGLVDTLTAMSSDIRAIRRLKSERKTKTLLQFLFIITTGCIIAPFVFGVVKSVLSVLIRVGGPAAGASGLVTRFDFLFKTYLIIESALSTLGAVQVRDGKMSKAVLYIPILTLVTYVIYMVIASQFLAILGGAQVAQASFLFL